MTAAAGTVDMQATLPARTAVLVFASFAFAYFLSALVRAVTATLAPSFSAELGLTSGDLGLLAGAYFLGFAATQLPLGRALDRFGPRRMLLGLLGVAVLGCAAFALASRFATLTLARGLIGVGVSACLMAPLTAYRRSFSPVAQLRANSWMLMSGSLGMVASTLPVQWLLPHIGWRGLFWMIGGLLALSMAAIVSFVPRDGPVRPRAAAERDGYAAICRHPTFVRFAPLGFFHYGGMIAIQSLWAGPWLVRVCGWTPEAAAAGLFAINLSMLAAFLVWGLIVPRLYRAGWSAARLVTWGVPLSLSVLLLAIALGDRATAWAWALFCVSSSVVSLSQPAVGQAFPAGLAGRALSAYNLVIFAGIFVLQWGLGLAIDAFGGVTGSTLSAFQGAMALFAACTLASYLWFLRHDDAVSIAGSGEPAQVADNFIPMPGLLIIAHAPLASSLKSVASHAFPECAQRLAALDVRPDMAVEQIEAEARGLLAKIRSPEALIFTDVFGATPCNVAQRLADGVQVKVVAGVNVPMLWRSLCYVDESLDSLVARAVAGATQGVMQVATAKPQNQTFKPGGNDQDHRHHQQ